MIEADTGDKRQNGVYNIGTVEASAQADLNDGHIYVVFGKITEGHGGGKFKKRRLEICL